jgi:hypothetical protein
MIVAAAHRTAREEQRETHIVAPNGPPDAQLIRGSRVMLGSGDFPDHEEAAAATPSARSLFGFESDGF